MATAPIECPEVLVGCEVVAAFSDGKSSGRGHAVDFAIVIKSAAIFGPRRGNVHAFHFWRLCERNASRHAAVPVRILELGCRKCEHPSSGGITKFEAQRFVLEHKNAFVAGFGQAVFAQREKRKRVDLVKKTALEIQKANRKHPEVSQIAYGEGNAEILPARQDAEIIPFLDAPRRSEDRPTIVTPMRLTRPAFGCDVPLRIEQMHRLGDFDLHLKKCTRNAWIQETKLSHQA